MMIMQDKDKVIPVFFHATLKKCLTDENNKSTLNFYTRQDGKSLHTYWLQASSSKFLAN